MLSFLKKVGLMAVKVIGIMSGLLPAVEAMTSATSPLKPVEDKLDQIVKAALSVEIAFTAAYGPDVKTGAQKVQALSALIGPIVQGAEVLSGKKLKNDVLFSQGLHDIANGVAEILNSYE